MLHVETAPEEGKLFKMGDNYSFWLGGGGEKQYLDGTSLICHIMVFSQMDLL